MNMDGNGMDRRVFVGNGAATLLLAGLPMYMSACATARRYEVTDDGTPIPLAVGDEWLYLESNGYNREPLADVRYVVDRVAPPRLRIEVDGKPLSGLRSGQFEEYATPWAVVRDTVYDLENRYESPLPLLPGQLEPGVRESWQSRVSSDPKEAPRRWNVQIDALGFERVSVPAGEFDALRIRRLIKFEHPDFFRSQSERTEQIWYAPQVRRWVKREWTGQYMPKLRSRHPLLREDWIVWELKSFATG